MMDKLALKITSLICTVAYNNEKDRARIYYGLSVLIGESFKIIFLMLFFNLIHRPLYFYFSLLILLSTRVFAGGIHLKGIISCTLMTTVMFIFTSVLAPLIYRLPSLFYIIVGFLCVVIVLIRAPICSVRRPIKDKKKKLQYKFIAALSVAIWTIVLLLLESTDYINCGFSTILVQNVQLLLVKKRPLLHDC